MILTTKGIDDLCLKYFVEAGAIAVRRVLPADIKRIARATGGEVVTTMSDMVRYTMCVCIMLYVYMYMWVKLCLVVIFYVLYCVICVYGFLICMYVCMYVCIYIHML